MIIQGINTLSRITSRFREKRKPAERHIENQVEATAEEENLAELPEPIEQSATDHVVHRVDLAT